MLIDKYSMYGLKIVDIYFSNKILNVNGDIIRYFQYKGNFKNEFLWKNFVTNIIDLNLPIDLIRKTFRKSIKSEINQAKKKELIDVNIIENVNYTDLDKFIDFYNKFALMKNLPLANRKKLERLISNIKITYAYKNNDILVYHLYIHDKERIRLLYSANNTFEKKSRLIIKINAKANKLLHFEDIFYFKNIGFKIYDFGGINLKDKNVKGIDNFKLGFSKNIEKSVHLIIPNSIKGKLIYKILKRQTR